MPDDDNTIKVRAAGSKNAQVKEEIKDAIFDKFESLGFENSRDLLLLHHYNEGEFVAASLQEKVSDDKYDKYDYVISEILMDHDKNKRTTPTCVWLHREWISEIL